MLTVARVLRWWTAQDRRTRAIVVSLVAALLLTLLLRPLLPSPATTGGSGDHTDSAPTPPVDANRPIPTSPSVPDESDEVDTVPCPPDDEFGFLADNGDLHDKLCIGSYITVWITSGDEYYDPELWLLTRFDRNEALVPVAGGVFFGPGTYCGVVADTLERMPYRIRERLGCQYWGTQPPDDSPHVQVAAQQKQLYDALVAGRTREVCAMLGRRATGDIEIGSSWIDENRGVECRYSQQCLEFKMENLLAIEGAQDPTLIQATGGYAATAGYVSGAFVTILDWRFDRAQREWQVSDLWGITSTGSSCP